MNAFVEARFYRIRGTDMGMAVAVDAFGRLFPIDNINHEWTPTGDFEALPEKTMSWMEFVTESRKLQPDMPQEYPMGNDAPIQ